ncbi:family 10 glycosylhydrolase [Histomonas meleagridis]|uniref:family 10 glycosylhydrolase n=1 Tax=Histomonas meleagridis TaxID=135588 RepID=UPI0035595DF8|nr:family 10 glycosylhydrolase [Histomonas meleagridis]KAH0800755.1 family 10 glycosylhydrolase [Histomonas meleagridis]
MFSPYGMEIDKFIQECVDAHITTISLQFKQDEDDYEQGNEYSFNSGTLYYPSKITSYATFFTNTIPSVIKAAHEKGIKIKAWVPQFHDYQAIQKNSEWQMIYQTKIGQTGPFTGSSDHEEYFVNPCNPDVQAYELSIIEEILTNYEIDSIVLDWVRFDSNLMDMSTTSLELFEKWCNDNGKEYINPINLNLDIEDDEGCEWDFLSDKWNPFRTSIISSYVTKVREVVNRVRPTCQLGLYCLDPLWDELGVDLSLFKNDIDFVSPMAYFNDFGEQPNWVYSEGGITDLVVQKVIGSNAKVIPIFDKNWKDSEYEEIMKGLRTNYPQITGIGMFNYIAWTSENFDTIKKVSEMQQIEEETTIESTEKVSESQSESEEITSEVQNETKEEKSETEEITSSDVQSGTEETKEEEKSLEITLDTESEEIDNNDSSNDAIVIGCSVAAAVVVIVAVVVTTVVCCKRRAKESVDVSI